MFKFKILSYMKSFIKNNKLLSVFLLFLIVLVPILVFAYSADTGYRIDPGATEKIYYKDASGQTSPISYYLSNSGSVSYFIPTRTLLEWESVYWKFPSAGLSLIDYCGNGLCGLCEPASVSGTTNQRIKYSPPSSNLIFDGYSYSCENVGSACPQDCGPIYCGDGDCTSDFYEDYSNCTADCKRCSSLDYYKCSYEYSGDKTGTCSDGWTTGYYINHCN